MTISASRLMRGMESIVHGYGEASVIKEVIDCCPFIKNVDKPENYYQIGLRTLIPKDWFEDKSNVILELSEIGRSVAMGEENFLVKKIQEESQASVTRTIKEFTLDSIESAIREIEKNGFSPSVLFAPVEFYVEMHGWKLAPGKMAIQYPRGSRPFLILDQLTSLKIFWSSMYIPLDKVLVFDRSFAKWIVKTEPNTGEYIQVGIKDSEDPDKVEVTAKTIVKFISIKPNALRILAPTKVPKIE